MKTEKREEKFVISKHFTGALMICMPCRFTGRVEGYVVHCSLAHLESVANQMVLNRETSASEIAMVASARYSQAQQIKNERFKKKYYKDKCNLLMDLHIVPSMADLKLAGMA